MATPPKPLQIFGGMWGQDQSPYSIKCDLENPLNAIAKITDIQGQHKIKGKHIIWNNVDQLSSNALLQLLRSSKDRFEVRFVPNTTISRYNVIITLKPQFLSPLKEKKSRPRKK